MIRPVSLNRELECVIFDDGATQAITNMYDEWGEETDDINQAFRIIAPDTDGLWHCIDMTFFDRMTWQ